MPGVHAIQDFPQPVQGMLASPSEPENLAQLTLPRSITLGLRRYAAHAGA